MYSTVKLYVGDFVSCRRNDPASISFPFYYSKSMTDPDMVFYSMPEIYPLFMIYNNKTDIIFQN